ncbi:MAG: PqqD family protein [Lachnospiraceae bacterium]|nr:PqqD family protein [Clostridiales bacterium]MCC8162744.1 PqqD family protein [Lachnospiraceae bacterium]
MKIKEGFVIRKVAGEYVAVATGEASREFQGMIKLNETAKTIWEGLADNWTRERIVESLAGKSGAKSQEDYRVIADDVNAMICEMTDAGFLTE